MQEDFGNVEQRPDPADAIFSRYFRAPEDYAKRSRPVSDINKVSAKTPEVTPIIKGLLRDANATAQKLIPAYRFEDLRQEQTDRQRAIEDAKRIYQESGFDKGKTLDKLLEKDYSEPNMELIQEMMNKFLNQENLNDLGIRGFTDIAQATPRAEAINMTDTALPVQSFEELTPLKKHNYTGDITPKYDVRWRPSSQPKTARRAAVENLVELENQV